MAVLSLTLRMPVCFQLVLTSFHHHHEQVMWSQRGPHANPLGLAHWSQRVE